MKSHDVYKAEEGMIFRNKENPDKWASEAYVPIGTDFLGKYEVVPRNVYEEWQREQEMEVRARFPEVENGLNDYGETEAVY